MRGTAHSEAAAILKSHGIRPRHHLGQNFLHDPLALQSIVHAAEIRDSDTVLEIGCGLGSLTAYLARRAQSVVAVEVDPKLASIADKNLRPHRNVRIICADFLKISPHDLGLPSGYVVVANIPYYITSLILRQVLESQAKPNRIVLTVQKEVAARICAQPPDMSLLAVSVQIHGSTRVVTTIPARAFYPVPRVDSAVVRIDCYEHAVVPHAMLATFFTAARAGFSQPRKMLGNALAAGLAIPAAQARAFLLEAGIDARRRAETLALAEWLQLSEVILSEGG